MHQPPAAWIATAHARARQHRRGTQRVRLVGRDGAPLAGRRIHLALRRTDFRVGCCINDLIRDPSATAEHWRAMIRSTFSSLVCENAMKWYAVEPQDGVIDTRGADAAVGFANGMGVPLRGHCLLWSKTKFVQPWVRELSPAALAERTRAHLDRMAGFAGAVSCWDGINELLDGDHYGERLGATANADLLRHYAGRDAATPLFVNEYGIMDSDDKTARYLDLIARLRAQGVRLGGIGVQEHAAERFVADEVGAKAEEHRPERQGRGPLIPEQVWARFDRLAATGLPIHLTEISIKTKDEARKADCLEALLWTAFAHRAVEQVLLWGFWGKSHWIGREAALVEDDLSPLPAWERLQAWLADRREAVTVDTDRDGWATWDGWHGCWSVGIDRPLAEIEVGPGRAAAVVSVG